MEDGRQVMLWELTTDEWPKQEPLPDLHDYFVKCNHCYLTCFQLRLFTIW
jgi:hypothetical protein